MKRHPDFQTTEERRAAEKSFANGLKELGESPSVLADTLQDGEALALPGILVSGRLVLGRCFGQLRSTTFGSGELNFGRAAFAVNPYLDLVSPMTRFTLTRFAPATEHKLVVNPDEGLFDMVGSSNLQGDYAAWPDHEYSHIYRRGSNATFHHRVRNLGSVTATLLEGPINDGPSTDYALILQDPSKLPDVGELLGRGMGLNGPAFDTFMGQTRKIAEDARAAYSA